MKRELRRIEETLHQIDRTATVLAPSDNPASTRSGSSASAIKSVSFELQPKTAKVSSAKVVASPQPATIDDSQIVRQLAPAVTDPAPAMPAPTLEPLKVFVQPFSVEETEAKIPNLPKLKAPSFSSHRNGANPALATNLLIEIQTIVEGWQTELHQILRQIQDLYLEGPIVDGWLESHSREPEVDSSVLRHAEVDRLMDYVEEICSTQDPQNQPVACESPRTGYRLCGLNPDGQLWSCPCPSEQVASLGLAIARHQKLRQLLGRKQDLETRLNHLAQTLVVMHSHLKE
ncbi:hypothetical protein C7B65_14885 [Phormidesmis priestleyi ULC007]|uniref:Uncharacterized protein n=1 Tax=Phormidesmis priestleyi ULC007 TaxID=1920490 RepID=A0A2T1DDL7_9CYAN|nr:hypothetical protein [Phormidesmis priestleyi]PSB18578.1 hypothetical protein C7B65_14885 [Phormidesmis priestleyi ULC007]PZO49773.1 MAG: hypothetical protein DCF14_13195 [Phormidesmis priestleyi]